MADILDCDVADAEAQFGELLDHIEPCRTVRITRHGEPIARLTPEPEARRAEAIDVVLASIHEGHKLVTEPRRSPQFRFTLGC